MNGRWLVTHRNCRARWGIRDFDRDPAGFEWRRLPPVQDAGYSTNTSTAGMTATLARLPIITMDATRWGSWL